MSFLRNLFSRPASTGMSRSASTSNSRTNTAERTTSTTSRTNSSGPSLSSMSAMESLKQNLAAIASTSDSNTGRKGKKRQLEVKLEEEDGVERESSSRRRLGLKIEETDDESSSYVNIGPVKVEPRDDYPQGESSSGRPRRDSSPSSRRKRKANDEDQGSHVPSSSSHSRAVKVEETEDNVPAASNGSVRRRGGLLTPHPSVGDALEEAAGSSTSAFVKNEPLDTFSIPRTPTRRSPPRTTTLPQTTSTSIAIQTSRTPSHSGSLSSLTQRLQTEGSRQGLFVSPTQSPSGAVVRKPSFIRLGEKEAGSFSDDLAQLARERERLEKELECVKRAEAELLSLFADYPASLRSSIDFDAMEGSSAQEVNDERARAGREEGSPPKKIKLELLAVDPGPSRQGDSASSTSDGRTQPSYAYALNPSDISSSSRISAATRAQSRDSVARSHLSESTYMSASESLSWSQHRDPLMDPSGTSYFVWFDLESTDAVRAAEKIRILEIAVCVSDKNFIPLDAGFTSLVHWPLTVEELKAEMPQKVREMHEKSGLFTAYANTPPGERLTLVEVEKRVCRYLRKHGISSGVLAGAGIAFDRGMVRQHMEKLDGFLGHQIFDTTSLWHLVRRKYNRTKRFADACAHRAMDDIHGSMREARTYSELLMKPPNEVQWPNNHNGI